MAKPENEIIVPVIPEGGNILLQAFTSEPFRLRIVAGIRRVLKLRAESGFSVMTNGQELVYPQLNLGTALADDDFEEMFLGYDGSTTIDPEMSEAWKDKHAFDERGYKVIGGFHFHTRNAAFSVDDIEAYDQSIGSGEIGGYRCPKDLFEGVFIFDFYSRRLLRSCTLFMFSGPATKTDYQTAQYGRMSLEAQAKLFADCGMKVVISDIPFINGAVDLKPLREKLLSL